MGLSDAKIKRFLIFSQKKAFFIFSKMELCTFQPKPKIYPEKISYTLIFSQKKAALMFQETKTQNFLIFSLKKSFSYTLGNRKPEKIL